MYQMRGILGLMRLGDDTSNEMHVVSVQLVTFGKGIGVESKLS